jgi:hypothetical protein
VAALLGDRVRSVFLVAGKLLTVVDLTVPAGDSFLEGKQVQALAADFNLLPLRCATADGTLLSRTPEALLVAGDRLTVIIGLNDLQRLLRRERGKP